ncbi:GTP-binding protein [Terrisporobacter petrolearius]|uniref:GTP-binding protein n=1 Tax=Terrisporobacter petrolearius TaxID=1460447 RepID=UPI003B0031EC
MSIKIDVISGFLGAGKTTFLNEFIKNTDEKIAIIENEFGDVSIDSDLIKGDYKVKELPSGCICCSLIGNFKEAILSLSEEVSLDRIIIEPSGVAMLSDIVKLCENICKSSKKEMTINNIITIVDLCNFYEYEGNFGNFYLNQIKNANIILLSHLKEVDKNQIKTIIDKLSSYNEEAYIIEEDWYFERKLNLKNYIEALETNRVVIKENLKETSRIKRLLKSITIDKPKVFTEEELKEVLELLKDKKHGYVLRAKGIIQIEKGKTVHFDFTPNNYSYEYMDEICEVKVVIIGLLLNTKLIKELF